MGEKNLSLKHVQPIHVETDDAEHPVLDNLKIKKTTSGIKYQSLQQSIQFFLERFPEGFYGDRFKEEERTYKEKAHKLASELLGKEDLSELLENNEYEEIVRRSMKVVNVTNLIFPNEKMALKDGLKTDVAQKSYSLALFDLLYGSDELQVRFNKFSNMLENIDAAKWTIVSYFLFILHPQQHMFVKPTIAQHSSELCGFEINYKPQLNWLTYKSMLGFSDYLFNELAELKPRDMTDVQSFMWCIAPNHG